jgi:predicted DCC family thiol-disulfide oxidoreductase YuxK
MNNHDLLNNSKPLLIFDGSCSFCTSCIRFVKKHDVNRQFDYADNNQIVTKLILAQHFIDSETLNTVVLIENNNVHIQSDAVIKTLLFLGGRWKVLGKLMIVFPGSFRNKVYNTIAANRNRHNSHCKI